MKQQDAVGPPPTQTYPRVRKPPEPVLVSSVQSGEVGVNDLGRATSGAPAKVTGLGTMPKGSFDRILLAEDNLVNQHVTVEMLERLGYCVDVVEDGIEAVTAAALVPYRAILMDCQIPVLNGFEATVEIRTREGASRNTSIIAVTSLTSDADRARCLAVGMDGFLAKPVSIDELRAGLTRWAPDRSAPADRLDLEAPQPTTTTGRTPMDGAEPALDPEVVDRLERLGAATEEDLVSQVTSLFLADAETRIVGLREALAQEDGPALILSAHTMCGASANLGATELSRLCARLATDGTVGDFEGGQALLHAVETELARVRSALLMWRPTLSQTETPSPMETPVPVPATLA
jgi:CheY-like chemotaxis protein